MLIKTMAKGKFIHRGETDSFKREKSLKPNELSNLRSQKKDQPPKKRHKIKRYLDISKIQSKAKIERIKKFYQDDQKNQKGKNRGWQR